MIVFFVPDLQLRGGEKVIYSIAKNISNKNILLLLGDRVELNVKGMNIISIHDKNLAENVYNPRIISGLLKTDIIIKKINPKVIITQGGKTGFIIALHKILFKPKYKWILSIGTHVSNRYKMLSYKLQEWITYRIYRYFLLKYPNKIIVPSKEMSEDLISLGIKKNKITVIPNPIDLKEIKEKMKEPLNPKESKIFDKLVLLNVGAYHYQKGQWYLIEIMPRLIKKFGKDIHLVLIGDGPLKKLYKRKIESLGLKDNIHLFGQRSNPYKYMARAKLFILSSLYEGFGIVLVEAMACGTPVISFGCISGPKEILDNGKYGLLVPLKNTNVLLNLIIKLLRNRYLYNHFKNIGLQRSKVYDTKSIVKMWEKIIEPKK